MKRCPLPHLVFLVAAALALFVAHGGAFSAETQARPSTAVKHLYLSLSGPPGAGKTTYGKMIAERYGIPHISVGKILRKEIADRTPLGLKVAPYVEKGELAPSELIMAVVKSRLAQDDCKKGFVLDGFPRKMSDTEGFEAIQKELKLTGFRMIGLEVSPETLIERMKNRRVCSKGHEYDIVNKPPKREGVCDIDGLALEARSDDTPEIIRNRFEVYQEETLPVVKYYKEKGWYVAIEEKGTIDEVFRSIVNVIEGGGK
ncbi:MAG: nucleoside monophosphate kinase [Candidatus Eremiobacteraeota bacterium]|nr:nucleoside monophosphate kinase [Candidatus Eremiobacteraeota bacterium]